MTSRHNIYAADLGLIVGYWWTIVGFISYLSILVCKIINNFAYLQHITKKNKGRTSRASLQGYRNYLLYYYFGCAGTLTTDKYAVGRVINFHAIEVVVLNRSITVCHVYLLYRRCI